MIKKLYLLIFILIATSISAQNKRPIFYGQVIDSVGPLANVHVINIHTNQGTFTNDNGEFRIFAQEKDSLQFSFVGYQTKKTILEHTNFGLSENKFFLEKQTEVLDEVVVKKHNLTGSLAIDIKKVPKDRIDDMMTSLMEGIMNIDYSTPVIEKIDEIDRAKAPIVNTSPIANGATLFSGSLFTSKKKLEQKIKINKLKSRDRFYKRLFTEVNKQYFIDELNIPKDSIYQFIDYCNIGKIQRFITEKNILELLKHLEDQSVAYLETIKR
ncbi:Carboxypeptidase-like protein [Tenacibaculum sp. 190130A14a]|uniref:Carboxypeptidase-like protein n=1 Tax=Tenacibaculum polynesiense TaxID=3137857 RepID=A0ABM9PCG5_9FLAO